MMVWCLAQTTSAPASVPAPDVASSFLPFNNFVSGLWQRMLEVIHVLYANSEAFSEISNVGLENKNCLKTIHKTWWLKIPAED